MFGSSQWMYNAGSEYLIEKSLKFTPDSSNSLYRTFSPGNRKTWTWSGWLKRSRTFEMFVFGASNGTNNDDNYINIQFFDGNLNFSNWTGSINVNCEPEYLDSSQWIHVVCAVDTTQESSEDRVIFYVNGARQSLQTSKMPSKDQELPINNATRHNIGERVGATAFWDGYMAEIHFVDGQALPPTEFGYVNEDYNNWVPKEVSISDYGTNGFYLPFTNSPFYHDMSGNNNNFTPQNFADYDVVLDTPTNNFATFSREDKVADSKLENGNLRSTGVQGQIGKMTSTISVSNGAWYFEVRAGTLGSTGDVRTIGIYHDGTRYATNDGNFWVQDGSKGFGQRFGFNVGYRDGSTIDDNVIDDSNFWQNGAIYGFAFDIDNDIIRFYKNGTLRYTKTSAGLGSYNNWVAAHMMECNPVRTPAQNWVWNFGQDSSFDGFTTSQGNTDANGQGDFYYSPPSGHLAMCSQNLPDPVVKPQENFNTTLFQGNASGVSQQISGVGFSPDLVWLKRRNAVGDHWIFDRVRGVERLLESSTQDVELLRSGSLTSFDSDGFTMGTNNSYNSNPYSIVSWNWKAGNTNGVTNTDGSITSTVSANPDAGFSIVTWTGNGANDATVGHGLNQDPEILIIKSRTSGTQWKVGYKEEGIFQLQDQDSLLTSYQYRYPNSSVFQFPPSGWSTIHDNPSGESMLAYCFHGVEGYCKIGQYYGNGSVDGPFIHTGFKPAFILIKRASATQHWIVVDNKRSMFNPGGETLFWSTSDPEYGTNDLNLRYTDLTANGFKIRAGVGTERNDNGSRYIYMAIAEQPFKYSNARGTSFDKVEDVPPSDNVIGQSLRFNFDSGSYLYRTPASDGNRRTFTISGWVKRGNIGSGYYNYILGAGDGFSSGWFDGGLYIFSDTVSFALTNSARNGREAILRSAAVLRDPSAWYHIMVAVDTTNSRDTERLKLYVNGKRITDFMDESYPPQNFSTVNLNSSSSFHRVGAESWTGGYNKSSGYLADVYFIDGQALTPDHFGYTDPTYGDWRPRSYGTDGDGTPEPNYGTNGFRLTFNSGSARIDQSGMGNHFSVNNFSETTDVVLDSPSNNFATWNPLTTNLTLREGNLNVDYVSNDLSVVSTIGSKTGKWYWEMRLNASTTGICYGVVHEHAHRAWTPSDSSTTVVGGFYGFQNTISKKANGSVISGNLPSVSSGSILMFALDCDNGRLWVGADGTWLDGGNPSTGSNPTFTGLDTNRWWFPVIEMRNSSDNINVNFGQDGTMAGLITAGNNSDSNGIGNFKYSVPTNFLSLCTSNIANPAVVPRENMNTVLYTGNGTTQKITGLGFQPDLVWIKRRDAGYPFTSKILDAVRGLPNRISTSETNAESTFETTGLTSFDSDGFTLGGDGGYNGSGHSVASWNWKAGNSTSTNTAGSINSTMSVNTDAGFSIITYTGNGISGATVGHGLGYEPDLVITKCRNAAQFWIIQHSSLSGRNYNMYFNTTDSQQADSQYLSMSSTTLTLNGASVNTNGNTYVSYCFREVPGYSKFGKYGANGSSNGPMNWCGFRPEFIIYKKYNGSEVWYIHDEERLGYNPENRGQYIHSAVNEYDSDRIDIVSNGFKIRNADSDTGANGSDYIYWAFAKHPFKFTNAR